MAIATKKSKSNKRSGKQAAAGRKAQKKASAKKPTARKATAKKQPSPKPTKTVASKTGAKKKKAAAKEPDRSAPAMAEVDADVLEFIAAIDTFKKEHGRPFPSWSEVLLIVRQLGYTR